MAVLVTGENVDFPICPQGYLQAFRPDMGDQNGLGGRGTKIDSPVSRDRPSILQAIPRCL